MRRRRCKERQPAALTPAAVVSSWVADGIRTRDIQIHKLTLVLVEKPRKSLYDKILQTSPAVARPNRE
jgi:hypothetical protein